MKSSTRAKHRPLRILILTQHFVPEVTAGRFRLEAFADGLAQRGHDVHVLCPVPNHPRGEIEPEYRGRAIVRRRIGSIRVTCIYVLTSPHKTLWTRLAYYGSYAGFAAAVGAIMGRPDVILTSSPPLPVAAVGGLLGIRHRAPFVLDIRDLWPYSAVALGELGPGRILSAAHRLERWVYARANRIVTTNEAFQLHIKGLAPPSVEVERIPNGTSEEWLAAGEQEPDRMAVGLPPDAFVWAYAGNLGLAHGLEHAIKAAALLGDDYLLLVIGEGPRREALEELAAETGARVEFRALMPALDAARHLRAADAVFVSERQERTVSAKLYDVCAVGRPVVAACRGELRRLVEAESIALPVEHGDPDGLAEAVRRLRGDAALSERLVRSARVFARGHLRSEQARRLAGIVEAAAGS